MISRVSELSRRLMSGRRWSRLLGGAIYGGLIGAALLLVGIAAYMIGILTGLDEFSLEGAWVAPLYVLAFALAGGVVGLLWKLTTNVFGALLASFLGMLVVSAGCILMVGFEEPLGPLPEVFGFAAFYSALLGTVAGLGIWWARLASKPSPRLEKALDRLLARCGATREGLSAGQLNVLRDVCRRRTFAKWALPLMAGLGVFMMYFGLVYAPDRLVSVLSYMLPSRVTIIDKAAQTRTTIGDDEKTVQTAMQVIMVLGAIPGLFAAMGAAFLGQAIGSIFWIWGRDPLVEFLKAAGKPPPNEEAGPKE